MVDLQTTSEYDVGMSSRGPDVGPEPPDPDLVMPAQRQRVTARDVAAVAGVTAATVSKALSGSREISEATRSRVIDAVARLGYRPNTVARGLRAKRTHTLGLITDDLEGLFTNTMLRGVEDVASGSQFGVFLCNSYGQSAKERQHLEMLLDKQVDGVVLLSGYRVRERGAPVLPINGVPTVYLFQYTRDLPVPCVVPDDVMGARLATEHLIGQGRAAIGFVNGPPHYEATHDRLNGYREALTRAGLPFRPELVRVAGSWHEDQGFAMTAELVSHASLDGLICASDHLAAGAVDALHSRQIDIPDDIAVVGFDDRPFARHLRPPLTSVRLPLYEMGRLAGHLILEAINGEPQSHQILKAPCELVTRESSGAQSAVSHDASSFPTGTWLTRYVPDRTDSGP